MKGNFEKLAREILEKVGGEDNVNSLTHCMTRLRFNLKNRNIVNKGAIEKIDGVLSVIEGAGQFQVVIGNEVGEVYKALSLISNIAKAESTAERTTKRKNAFAAFLEVLTGIFTPVLGVMAASGVLAGLLTLAANMGILNKTSGTYLILNIASNSLFNFLPIILAVSAAKKFESNPYIGMAIGGALVHPNFTALVAGKDAINFLGLPVQIYKYSSSVFPIILAVWIASYIEKFLNKKLHSSIKAITTPLVVLVIMVPLTFLAFGPVATKISGVLAAAYVGAYNLSPVIAGAMLGGLWQILIIFGIHWGFVPIFMNNIATLKRDTCGAMFTPSNYAQAGAALGVFLKTKDAKLKTIAGSGVLSALLGGIVEPVTYGVTLKYKKPFVITVITGAIAGAIAGYGGAARSAAGPAGLFSVPVYVGEGFKFYLIAITFAFIFAAIATYLFGYNDGMLEDKEDKKKEVIKSSNNEVFAPIKGKTISLSEIKDKAFSEGQMGKGVAVIPEDGKVFSPINGEVSALFPTGHAIAFTSKEGIEVLIHIGLDTVELEGKFFKTHVKQGDVVEKGQLVLEFDVEKIKEAGYDVTTPIVVTNTASYKDILVLGGKQVTEKDMILQVVN